MKCGVWWRACADGQRKVGMGGKCKKVLQSGVKWSKVDRSTAVQEDRSDRSLKPVSLLFSKIPLNLRKPPKPSFPPPSKPLDPILSQKVMILLTRLDWSSVRSGSQRNMLTRKAHTICIPFLFQTDCARWGLGTPWIVDRTFPKTPPHPPWIGADRGSDPDQPPPPPPGVPGAQI